MRGIVAAASRRVHPGGFRHKLSPSAAPACGERVMSPSLRALLEHVIDYAGLFPPATLPLDEAVRNYARYRTEPEGWMLGRFICPAARLAELSPFADELFPDWRPLAVAVLGRGGNNA